MGGTASPSPAHGSDARRYILEKQLPNGWLGPDDGFGGVGNTYWTGWNTAASLLQYADSRRAASDEDTARRCEKATLRYIQEVTRRMKIHPMSTWSQNRWQDWAYIVHWSAAARSRRADSPSRA